MGKISNECFEFYKESQICQDRELTQKFSDLHTELVNRVIEFCKENKLECDAFCLYTDGLLDSRDWGYWTPGTDSSCWFREHPNDDKPFLHEI